MHTGIAAAAKGGSSPSRTGQDCSLSFILQLKAGISGITYCKRHRATLGKGRTPQSSTAEDFAAFCVVVAWDSDFH